LSVLRLWERSKKLIYLFVKMGQKTSRETFMERLVGLGKRSVSVDEVDYWSELFGADVSLYDVFDRVRSFQSIVDAQRSNLLTMCTTCAQNIETMCSYLCQVGSEQSEGDGGEALKRELVERRGMTSVALLTRLMPLLFACNRIVTPLSVATSSSSADDGDDDASRADVSVRLADALFWSQDAIWRRHFQVELEASVDEANGNVDNGDDETLGERLLNALVSLLFVAGFTTTLVGGTEALWFDGIGSIGAVPPGESTAVMISRRTTLLKCLLVCCAESLYDADAAQRPNLWLNYLTRLPRLSGIGGRRGGMLPTLFFSSLVNVVCAYDPIGWGVPYNHVLFSDSMESLNDVALHLLVILLNHKPSLCAASTRNALAHASIFIATRREEGGEAEEKEEEQVDVDEKESAHSNVIVIPYEEGECVDSVFAELLRDLSDASDFEALFGAFSRLLNNQIEAKQSLLPNSVKQVGCHKELLMLFWKVIQESQAFLVHALRRVDAPRLVVPILELLATARKDPSLIGVIHLSTFVLLVMSGEREFGIALNNDYRGSLPADLPLFVGNHADLLVLTFHKLLTDGQPKLRNLHECLLTIVANISPYIKSLSVVSASKLVRLFEQYSRPHFLLANPRHHLFTYILLEAFDNIIQYQYEGNAPLIYEIICNRNTFTQLDMLTFKHALDAFQHRGQRHHRAPPQRDEGEEQFEGARDGEAQTDDEDSQATTPIAESSSSLATPVAAASSSSFVPAKMASAPRHISEAWFQEWKSKLPISTVLRLIAIFTHKVTALCMSTGVSDEQRIIEFIQKTTLVGLLPVPHPILIRRYQPSESTSWWFLPYIWHIIAQRQRTPILFPPL
jgi:Dyggve-Melchior-Clausen syndrome protein